MLEMVIDYFLSERSRPVLGTTELHIQKVAGRGETLTTHLNLVHRLRMSGATPTKRQPYLLTHYLQSSQASDGKFSSLNYGSLSMDKVRCNKIFKILLACNQFYVLIYYASPSKTNEGVKNNMQGAQN